MNTPTNRPGRLRSLLLIIVFFMSLLSCGGGGGGDGGQTSESDENKWDSMVWDEGQWG